MANEVPRRMELLKWSRARKGTTLVGFADIRLPNGLRIYGCVLHRAGNGRCWGGWPGRLWLDENHRHVEEAGKFQYSQFLEWETWDLRAKFSDALVGLVRAHDPGAFEEEAPMATEIAPE